MKSRPNGIGLGVALALASVSLTYSSAILAQEAAAEAPPPEAAPDEPQDPTLDASLSGSTDATLGTVTEPAASEPEPEPIEDLPGGEAEPPKQAPVETEKEEAAGTEKEPSDDWGVNQLRIVQTPWTAYPSAYVRGITYGSLWRTFHGQQWPYMRGEEKDAPAIQIGVSGYIWNDLSHARIDVDQSLKDNGINDQRRWTTQTRGVLRITPTYNVGKGWFVQGNSEFVVQGDMRPDPNSGVLATTDDVWVRFGKWDLFDITVGRFQGWEIANHYGMALDWATLERQGAWVLTAPIKPTDGYGLDYFWDRQNFLLGGYAAHFYPTKWLRGEFLAHIGSGNGRAASPYQFDIRPSVIFDIGFLKIKAGYEYGKATPQDTEKRERETKNGFGAAAQVVLAPYVEFGGSFARGYTDVLDSNELVDLGASNTAQSFGGFINVSPGWEPLVIGGGAFLKSWKEFRLDDQGNRYSNDQWLVYGAVQYTLWKQLYLKAVVSHASNRGTDQKFGEYINNALSGRFRAEFLF